MIDLPSFAQKLINCLLYVLYTACNQIVECDQVHYESNLLDHVP